MQEKLSSELLTAHAEEAFVWNVDSSTGRSFHTKAQATSSPSDRNPSPSVHSIPSGSK
jgi:hypothetical protein